ncbi:MAG: hypothetical protein WCF85_10970 [Rhodospirillaceae bacterium]
MFIPELQALVTATVTPASCFDAMMTDIGSALNGLGVVTRTLLHASDYPNPALMKALVLQLRDGGLPGVVVNCNAKDELILEHRDGNPLTIHDAWNIPLIAFMADHPACHVEYLRRAPENAVITVIDEGHLTFLEDAGFRPRTRIFCPHGGPEPLPVMRRAEERGIDLLMVGLVDDPGPFTRWLNEEIGARGPARRAIAEAYSEVREEGREVYAALVEAYGRARLDARPLALAKNVAALDAFATRTRRLEVLRAIKDRRVVIAGEVAPSAGLDHHDIRGPVVFAKALSMMSDARILLNSRWTYGRGAHERVFYGMSRGAVVATEDGSFLRDELRRQAGMVALPRHPVEINDMLCTLCEAPDRLNAIRERGLSEYVKRHSWRERAVRMITALGPHFNAPYFGAAHPV